MKDEMFDLAREHISAIEYAEFYVAPQYEAVDPSSYIGSWPSAALEIKTGREDFRSVELGTFTEEEKDDFRRFQVYMYAFDSEGNRYSF